MGLSGSSGHMKKCMQNAFFRYGMSWHIETKFHITSLVLLQRIYLFHHCYQVSLLQREKFSPPETQTSVTKVFYLPFCVKFLGFESRNVHIC